MALRSTSLAEPAVADQFVVRDWIEELAGEACAGPRRRAPAGRFLQPAADPDRRSGHFTGDCPGRHVWRYGRTRSVACNSCGWRAALLPRREALAALLQVKDPTPAATLQSLEVRSASGALPSRPLSAYDDPATPDVLIAAYLSSAAGETRWP